MPSALPEADPAPSSGRLPGHALEGLGQRPFGIYVHVPFCATRCGYCDFTTYTPGELEGPGHQGRWLDAALEEVRLAHRLLGDVPVNTVFFGGGTPTLVGPTALTRVLREVDDRFGLLPGAEVTTEANPDSVGAAELSALRAAGFTRVSFGMQSAVPHVLAALDRTHTPGRAVQAVGEAQAAGFDHVSLDLIYGAPGESLADWRASLEAALAARPDHVSAYALVVEPGTRLAARVRRGELAAPDDDDLAEKYELADDVLTAGSLPWYEVSNWAHGVSARCRHNEGYWSGGDWWGVGPGAHSHVGGVRWWNARHPAAYAAVLREGRSPAVGREVLTPAQHADERVLLGVRRADGLPLSALPAPERARRAVDDGLAVLQRDRLVLTRRGRLLADAVVRDLLG